MVSFLKNIKLNTFKNTKNLGEDKSIRKDVRSKICNLIEKPNHDHGFRTPIGQLDLTDLSFAEHFIYKFSDIVKFNIDAKKWYVWKKNVWVEDKAKLHSLVKKCIKVMFEFAIKLKDKTEKNDFLKFCNKCESRISIDNMLNLASREEKVCRRESDFDSHPEYLNCKNVMIDLSGKKFKIIKHDPKLLIRQITNIDYIKGSVCEYFLDFLNMLFDNNEKMIKFIQQAIGYSLSGYTTEHCLFFMYGTGRNGKSTFAEILRILFGDYYHKANIELLLQQKNVIVRNDIADLYGKRLVITSEIDEGKRFAENLVKDLTGGDDITARHLYQEQITFTPVSKFWIYGNHKPVIKGTDEGIKRRFKLIPFKSIIPEEKIKSRYEISQNMKAEMPGILIWCLKGFNDWREDGKLIFPEEVKEATKEYFNEMDLIQNFIDDCIIVDPYSKSKVKDLYDIYKQYSEENGDRPMGSRNFSKALKEKGFQNSPGTNNVYYWDKILIKNESELQTS